VETARAAELNDVEKALISSEKRVVVVIQSGRYLQIDDARIRNCVIEGVVPEQCERTTSCLLLSISPDNLPLWGGLNTRRSKWDIKRSDLDNCSL
jgi:hypothetical protein